MLSRGLFLEQIFIARPDSAQDCEEPGSRGWPLAFRPPRVSSPALGSERRGRWGDVKIRGGFEKRLASRDSHSC
jgi:hypothetical protein